DPAAATQPAPSNSNYRGGAWSTSLTLAGHPAGIYTLTTHIQDTTKIGLLGACTKVNDPDQVSTFEYRPWQLQFHDLPGTGNVRMNTNPPEFQFDVSGFQSPLVTGATGVADMKFYALPS